jgi:hypothetical protein
MNAKTRRELAKMSKQINDLTSKLEQLRIDLECMYEEEQEKYNNMPEQLQETENGCRMYECIEALEDVFNRLDYQVAELYDITNDIEHITEI